MVLLSPGTQCRQFRAPHLNTDASVQLCSTYCGGWNNLVVFWHHHVCAQLLLPNAWGQEKDSSSPLTFQRTWPESHSNRASCLGGVKLDLDLHAPFNDPETLNPIFDFLHNTNPLTFMAASVRPRLPHSLILWASIQLHQWPLDLVLLIHPESWQHEPVRNEELPFYSFTNGEYKIAQIECKWISALIGNIYAAYSSAKFGGKFPPFQITASQLKQTMWHETRWHHG